MVVLAKAGIAGMVGTRYWIGVVPRWDDFGVVLKEEFVDGKTIYGPWAMMAPESFMKYGIGTGLGVGQRYRKQRSGRWMKVEG